MCLFHHPNVERLWIAWVSFRGLEMTRDNYFRHENLTTLVLESYRYSREMLKRMIISSKSMTNIAIYHKFRLPWPSQDYPPILAHAADTLKLLTLKWIDIRTDTERGMDLRKFKALKRLLIDPSFLLGSYTEHCDDLPQRLAKNLPPNIKELVLEGLVSPYPPPAPNLVETLPAKHVGLLRTLIEQKEALAPSLKAIDMDRLQSDSDFPEQLKDLAQKHGIDLGLLSNPSMDEDTRWMD